jgi:hypothetical protein
MHVAIIGNQMNPKRKKKIKIKKRKVGGKPWGIKRKMEGFLDLLKK